MKNTLLRIFAFMCIGGGLLSDPYKPLDIDFLKTQPQKKETPKKKQETSPKKENPNAFETIIKDYSKIEGLFTFYIKDDINQVYMELNPEQFDKLYMVNITRETGDGAMRHGVSMQGEYPFYFKKIGNVIQFVEKNVKFRSNNNPEMAKALRNQIPDSIIRSVKPVGEPHPETGAILINANKLFIFDTPQIAGQRIQFDKSNSFLKKVKSFEFNSEIQVDLNYRTKGMYVYTLADSRNITYTYHYSLSALPDSDYSPRRSDDRVGYFLTLYQDYNDILTESPYVRYINRWNLKKKYPDASLSEPIKPIEFWLENTIPIEFRKPITQGILAWNDAFESIGFKNAIVVRQMADDADWDPADVRYSTIRWLVQPGVGIGVGPSRANPFTGETDIPCTKITTESDISDDSPYIFLNLGWDNEEGAELFLQEWIQSDTFDFFPDNPLAPLIYGYTTTFIVNEDDYPGEDVYVRKFIGYKIDFVMIYVIQSTNY